jgi:hypothetical protein
VTTGEQIHVFISYSVPFFMPQKFYYGERAIDIHWIEGFANRSE